MTGPINRTCVPKTRRTNGDLEKIDEITFAGTPTTHSRVAPGSRKG